MLTKWKYLPHAILAVAFGLTLVVFRDHFASMQIQRLRHFVPELFGVLSLALISYLIRSYRWRWMLHRLGYPIATGFAHLTYLAGFAFTLAPGKVGELAKCVYYRGFPRSRAATAYAIERAVDLVAFIGLASLLSAALASHYYLAIWIPGLVVSVGAVVLVVLSGAWLESRREWLPRFIAEHAQEFFVTVRTLLTWAGAARLLLMGMLAWGSEAATLYLLCGVSTSVDISLADAIGIYAVAMILGAVSFLPGGLGTTEATMLALLVSKGVPVSDALLITATCRFLTLWYAIVMGWGAVGYLRWRNDSVSVARKNFHVSK